MPLSTTHSSSAPLFFFQTDEHRTARWRELERVAEQIENDLLEHATIHTHQLVVERALKIERQTPRARQRLRVVDDLPDQIVHVGGLAQDLLFASLEPREIQ
jgi:hypothetical protein